MQICGLEHGLYEHFFPDSASSPAALAPLLDPLCTLLYDVLRPAIVSLQDIDALCELVDILKIEVCAHLCWCWCWCGWRVVALPSAVRRVVVSVASWGMRA